MYFCGLKKNTSMMKYLSRILLITFVFVFSATYSHADSWRDKQNCSYILRAISVRTPFRSRK